MLTHAFTLTLFLACMSVKVEAIEDECRDKCMHGATGHAGIVTQLVHEDECFVPLMGCL